MTDVWPSLWMPKETEFKDGPYSPMSKGSGPSTPSAKEPRPRPTRMTTYEPLPGEGGNGLPMLLAVVVIAVVVYMFMSRDDIVETPESPAITAVDIVNKTEQDKRIKYRELCKPDYYVRHIRAADGLDEVTCKDKSGVETTQFAETAPEESNDY